MWKSTFHFSPSSSFPITRTAHLFFEYAMLPIPIRTLVRSVRGLHSSSSRLASRTSRSNASTSASQPVLKRDAPAAPSPPFRPTPSPTPPVTPTSTSSAAGGKVRDGGKPGSVYHSYKSLPYNTKLVFWTCGASKSFSPPFTLFYLLFFNSDKFLFGCESSVRGSGVVSSRQVGRTLPRTKQQTPNSNPARNFKRTVHRSRKSGGKKTKVVQHQCSRS